MRVAAALILAAGIASCVRAPKPMPPIAEYPPARRDALVETLHGVAVADPYRWMEDIDAPETRAWVEAQSALAEGYLRALPDRESIRERLERVWDFEKYGVPVRKGLRSFFTYNDGLRNQYVLCVQDGADGDRRVLLDPNALSEDGTVALTGWSPSPDGRLVAYALSSSGSDWKEWRVRDASTGRDLPDLVKWSKFSGASWLRDGSGFFYSAYDAPAEGEEFSGTNYFQKLYFHRLGTAQADDLLVYERPDEKEWGFSGDATEDGRYLVVSVFRGTHKETNVFYKDLASEDPVVELLTGFTASWVFVGNRGTTFYFRTDREAPLGRIVAIDIRRPDDIREIVPESPDTLDEATLVGGGIVASYLANACSRVRLFGLDGTPDGEIPLPGIGSAGGFTGEMGDRETFFSFTGFATPGEIWRHDFSTGETVLERRPRVAFDPDDFVTEQVRYASKDGTSVPMFVSRRRDTPADGRAPVLLYGYGGFNIPMSPYFSASMLVWMERGGVLAIPNIRGGGEFGESWYRAGTVLRKQNVFDDFMAAADWLVATGRARRERLAIGGGSNGGLLVGACLTQRPDLCGAAWCSVGVLDMLRYDRFTIGWAWKSDYGDPAVEEEFRALLAYSPYHAVREGTAYPPVLIATADHDDRVHPAHSFKFGAALQHAQAGGAPIVLRIETKAGHGAGTPTSKAIEERADLLAFLESALSAPYFDAKPVPGPK